MLLTFPVYASTMFQKLLNIACFVYGSVCYIRISINVDCSIRDYLCIIWQPLKLRTSNTNHKRTCIYFTMAWSMTQIKYGSAGEFSSLSPLVCIWSMTWKLCGRLTSMGFLRLIPIRHWCAVCLPCFRWLLPSLYQNWTYTPSVAAGRHKSVVFNIMTWLLMHFFSLQKQPCNKLISKNQALYVL